jgi:hypothetical protein
MLKKMRRPYHNRWHNLPIYWLFLATSCFAIFVNIQSGDARIVCKSSGHRMDCNPTSLVSEELSGYMQRSLELFEKNLCRVNEASLSNEAWTKETADEVEFYIRYECDYSQGETNPSTSQQKVKLGYRATARYEFLCAPQQYKMFESGFDFYSNGTQMHWDSQGSSRPIPWRQLPVEDRDRRLIPLFRIWCE